MRLPDFITANVEPILKEWESFARSIWPGPAASSLILRDHAGEMLLAMAKDMKSSQTDSEQALKAKGLDENGQTQQEMTSDQVDGASNLHALSRLSSGFELRELVAEYRALRASVIHLWVGSSREPGQHEIEDIIRFNEAIDQSLTVSIASFVRSVDVSRECFLGILGHDLRTPLAAAKMMAYLMAESTTLDRQALEMADTLRTSLDAMELLIRDLLDFTGTRLGAKMVVSATHMELPALCREVLDEMRAAHPKRSFIFISPDAADLAGEWDYRRLRQLISNLLGNAVQHGSASTPITLTVDSTETCVRLEFHNVGPSIPEEMVGVIFDPMKRRHSNDSAAPHGSIGLGLYIAREVATAHGGSIAVASARDETTFTVELPRHSAGSSSSIGTGAGNLGDRGTGDRTNL